MNTKANETRSTELNEAIAAREAAVAQAAHLAGTGASNEVMEGAWANIMVARAKVSELLASRNN